MTRQEKFDDFLMKALDSVSQIAKRKADVFKSAKNAGIKYPNEEILFGVDSEDAFKMAVAGTLDDYSEATDAIRDEIRSFYDKISKKPE